MNDVGKRPLIYYAAVDVVELNAFVDRLTCGGVSPSEFRALTIADWQQIDVLLRARRHVHMQHYVNALLTLRLKHDLSTTQEPKTYSEAEILAELEETLG